VSLIDFSLPNNFGHDDEIQLVEKIYSTIDRDLILASFRLAFNSSFYSDEYFPFELMYIPIYSDSRVEVNINLFFGGCDGHLASGLIHNHGPFRLYSKHLYGSGFKYLSIKKNKESEFLPIEGMHECFGEYITEPYELHVLFGAKTTTATLAIWIHDYSQNIEKERQNFYVKNGRILSISDFEFSRKVREVYEKIEVKDYKLFLVAKCLVTLGIADYEMISSITGIQIDTIVKKINTVQIKNNLKKLSMEMSLQQIKEAFSRVSNHSYNLFDHLWSK